MSTSSHIGIINKDKTITTIYCHWDGYPSHHTPILLNNYNTEEKIRELIALGNISVLAENITPIAEHSFENPEKKVVVAYHRDRNDKWEECKPKQYKSKNDVIENASASYIYLFDVETNTWQYTKNKQFRTFTKPIKS